VAARTWCHSLFLESRNVVVRRGGLIASGGEDVVSQPVPEHTKVKIDCRPETPGPGMWIIHRPEPRPGIVNVGGALRLTELGCCLDPRECRVGRLDDNPAGASLARTVMSLVTVTSRCSRSASHQLVTQRLECASCLSCRHGFPFQKLAAHASSDCPGPEW
jgi:hypothetical protein